MDYADVAGQAARGSTITTQWAKMRFSSNLCGNTLQMASNTAIVTINHQ